MDRYIMSEGGKIRIALVVRGKLGHAHHPGNMEQHADCILDDGSPIGFFGHGNNNSGNGIGLRMDGVVYQYPEFQTHRPWYVNTADAVSNRVVSTVLMIEVTRSTADAFKASWDAMILRPGNFNILGGNCATHASAAFIDAGVVSGGIPGLDTPDNLYGQLVRTVARAKLSAFSGHIGFVPRASGGYIIESIPYVYSPAANTPRGSTSSN
ncbi:MAG: hypothetical protein ACK4PG_11775 [Acetobacteraceae bacterium]